MMDNTYGDSYVLSRDFNGIAGLQLKLLGIFLYILYKSWGSPHVLRPAKQK